MQNIKIAPVDKEKFYKIPAKANASDGAYDMYVSEDILWEQVRNGTVVCPTNIKLEIPEGWCARIWPRSGLAAKGHKVHPGLIDYGYTTEIKVIVYPQTDGALPFAPYYLFKQGERIAQLELRKLDNYILTEEDFDGTNSRGGFGSSGQNEFISNENPKLVQEPLHRDTCSSDFLL